MEEEQQQQQQICCGKRSSAISDFLQLPTSSSGLQYPWLVSYDTECKEDTDTIFSTMLPNFHQNRHYHCRIPELRGRKIQGCFHGWLVLSKLTPSDSRLLEFCLWNPVTREFIDLPPLKLEWEGRDDNQPENDGDSGDDDDIMLCCLSSPPSNPDSVLLLTRFSKPNIVFYPLGSARKQWTELSYANQIRNISNRDNDEINSMFCCNGNVYAFTSSIRFIQVAMDILVDQGVINLLPLGKLPGCQLHLFIPYVTGNSNELFTIIVCFNDNRLEKMQSIKLFKLDFSTKTWEELKSAKDRVFFLVECSYSQISCLATHSESGSYIHIIRDSCKVYSYNVEDKTISLSSLPCPDLPPGLWPHYCSTWVMPENRLVVDHGETNCRSGTDEEQGEEEEIGVKSVISGEVDRMMNEHLGEKMIATTDQGPLLHIPLHIVELIVERCVAIDYLNFRATCKHCRLAAPPIRWSTVTALGKLPTPSLVSPWLMVLDEDQGITTFTDPKFGDKYFMTTFIGHVVICASKYGWLLIYEGDFVSPIFFNPFTKVTIQLPQLEPTFSFCYSFAFSEPPTSPSCMVAAFVRTYNETVHITFPGESEWHGINIHQDIPYNLSSHNSRIFYGENLYTLCRDGELGILRVDQDFSWEILVVEPPRTCTSCTQHFLVECGNDLLLITVGEFGQWVEVFKLNHSPPQWEKVYDVGKHMIYICDKTCFSVVAKIPGMENKIYFPRFRGGNIVFYSLDTCRFHTFGGKGKDQEEAFMDFFPTKEQLMGVWIEPSWSS